MDGTGPVSSHLYFEFVSFSHPVPQKKIFSPGPVPFTSLLYILYIIYNILYPKLYDIIAGVREPPWAIISGR